MKEKLLHKRALVTCIAMLFVCIILKLFGVQWFDLNTDIPLLKNINDIVYDNEFLSFMYSFIFKYINGYLVCCIARKERKFYLVPLGIICVISMILSRYFNNYVLIMLYDTFSLYLLCFDKCSFWEYLLVVILNVGYQFISLFIRSLGYQCSYYGLITSVIFMLDYYIMLVITYLYLVKGDKTLCGIVLHFGSYLATKLWKKRSENYSNKEGN